MSTFEITIQRKSGSSWPIVVEYTRLGAFLPVRSEGTLDLDLDELRSQATSLDYGAVLGKALFRGRIFRAFDHARTESQGSQDYLHVLLFVEDAALKTLRWERLCISLDDTWSSSNGDLNFLALNQQVPFSLYLPSGTDQRFPPIGRRDLRALILVASPEGLEQYQLEPFNVEVAVSSVRVALGNIDCDVLATIEGAIGPPTLDGLTKQLVEKQYTLLHFVCHGRFLNSGETVLYWAKAENQVDPIEGSRLLRELRTSSSTRLPHFSFLSTCESARPEAEGALGGLAQRMVRDLGMPAVLAMTEKVSVTTAQALAENFYRRLREHGQVDLALVQATAGLAGRYDITVPALFSRLSGQPLFSDTLDRDLTNQEIQFGLCRLQNLLEERAPILCEAFDRQATILRGTLGVEPVALSRVVGQQRKQALVEVNNLCDEVLDLSFNALALGQEPPPYDVRCPFRGLHPFRVEDHEFFFGRDLLIEQLKQKLAEHNLLAVLGPSASGKSSVVLAGLVPLLQKQESGLQMAYLTPSSEPLVQIEASLLKVQDQPAVVVVDQFEELFTLCTDEAKRLSFIACLLTIAQTRRVIIIMRSDFWEESEPYTELKEIMQAKQALIAPMGLAELRKAMEMQATEVGLSFEANLSNLILDEVQEEPGAMPLLQQALQELWKRRHGRWLRTEEYRAIGGVRQVIIKIADDLYQSLQLDKQEQVRNIFVRLTRLDDAVQNGQTRDMRQLVGAEELVPAGSDPVITTRIVSQLADARLVITKVDQATGREEVEVAYEALIRHWPRLQDWLKDRESLQLHQQIRKEAVEWQAGKKKDELLLLWESRLEKAEALSKQSKFAWNKLEMDYLKACAAQQERKKAEHEALQKARTVSNGLYALIPLIQLDNKLRAAVDSSKEILEETRDQVNVLADWKDLHDLLHDTQVLYHSSIALEAKKSSDEVAWEDLENFEFDSIVSRLQKVINRPSLAQNTTMWIEDLVKSQEKLRGAIEKQDTEHLNDVEQRMKRVLDTEPGKIDSLLIMVAKQLHLSKLVRAMKDIYEVKSEKLAHPGHNLDKLRQFKDSIDDLSNLSRRLTDLLKEHNGWQVFYNNMRRIEEDLEKNKAEIEESWDSVKKRVEPLYKDSLDGWAVSFKEDAEKLAHAIKITDLDKEKQYFRRLLSRSVNRFYLVDKALKSLCSDLRLLYEPLDSILRTLQ